MPSVSLRDARVPHHAALGHASIKTTLDRYRLLLPKDDAFRDGREALYVKAKTRPDIAHVA
jgi:hypothetical protein